ncbi:MAG: tRNA 2-thiouridine(34) synthase MnmA [Candidatus Omnitrophica bacterium]|nr:tRNA 2-thiouridine(34) synthase MnmA [Candidatus Omnitrophota bacterium]
MRVVVAMSGGVDSSVAALLIRDAGYEGIGITMKTWPQEDCGAAGDKLCCSLEAVQFARSVAEDLSMPFYVVNYSDVFEKEVTDYFAAEYERGRTPNPCIYCNSRIKFGHLYRKALSVGAEKIATGHYARMIEKNGSFFLSEGVDKKKDQSYFLFAIPREMLPKILFPVGELRKEEVRRIALEKGFMNAEREESQDICFATKDGDYRKYISARVGAKAFTPGDVLDVSGKVVGRHEGIAGYTLGQRKGLGIAMGKPVYVLRIDTANNTVVIGGQEHAMKKKISVSGLNWLIDNVPENPTRYGVKIRYLSKKADSTVTPVSPDKVTVEFDAEQFAPTPGQAAVFYDGEIVAGGGWIDEALE